MRQFFLSLLCGGTLLLAAGNVKAQALKAGVFDIDLMVQAMPGYHLVDSLVQQYETDSLGIEYEYYQLEYQRLDSTYKADSALVAAGKKAKALLDFTAQERMKMGMNIVYWRQIAQNKSNNKRAQLARPLYAVVIEAYKRVLARKKYTLILKPQTYEAGFPIDNVFIATAKELKLTSLPQELISLGDDPDPVKPPVAKPPAAAPKTK